MTRFLIFELIAVMVVVSTTSAAKNYVPERKDFTFKTQVFTTTDDDFTVADSIITTVTDKSGKSFQLVSLTEPLDPEYWRGFGDIVEDDINFDGIPDLMICLGPTNAFGGFTYDGYVWDNQLHKFIKIENFNEIMDPAYVPSENKIIGTFRIDNNYWTSVYQWQNGKLVLIDESIETIDINDEQ